MQFVASKLDFRNSLREIFAYQLLPKNAFCVEFSSFSLGINIENLCKSNFGASNCISKDSYFQTILTRPDFCILCRVFQKKKLERKRKLWARVH